MTETEERTDEHGGVMRSMNGVMRSMSRFAAFMEVDENRRAVNRILFGEEHADFDWSYIPRYFDPVTPEAMEVERRRRAEIDRLIDEWERSQKEAERWTRRSSCSGCSA